jgi:hypothetical protein
MVTRSRSRETETVLQKLADTKKFKASDSDCINNNGIDFYTQQYFYYYDKENVVKLSDNNCYYCPTYKNNIENQVRNHIIHQIVIQNKKRHELTIGYRSKVEDSDLKILKLDYEEINKNPEKFLKLFKSSYEYFNDEIIMSKAVSNFANSIGTVFPIDPLKKFSNKAKDLLLNIGIEEKEGNLQHTKKYNQLFHKLLLLIVCLFIFKFNAFENPFENRVFQKVENQLIKSEEEIGNIRNFKALTHEIGNILTDELAGAKESSKGNLIDFDKPSVVGDVHVKFEEAKTGSVSVKRVEPLDVKFEEPKTGSVSVKRVKALANPEGPEGPVVAKTGSVSIEGPEGPVAAKSAPVSVEKLAPKIESIIPIKHDQISLFQKTYDANQNLENLEKLILAINQEFLTSQENYETINEQKKSRELHQTYIETKISNAIKNNEDQTKIDKLTNKRNEIVNEIESLKQKLNLYDLKKKEKENRIKLLHDNFIQKEEDKNSVALFDYITSELKKMDPKMKNEIIQDISKHTQQISLEEIGLNNSAQKIQNLQTNLERHDDSSDTDETDETDYMKNELKNELKKELETFKNIYKKFLENFMIEKFLEYGIEKENVKRLYRFIGGFKVPENFIENFQKMFNVKQCKERVIELVDEDPILKNLCELIEAWKISPNLPTRTLVSSGPVESSAAPVEVAAIETAPVDVAPVETVKVAAPGEVAPVETVKVETVKVTAPDEVASVEVAAVSTAPDEVAAVSTAPGEVAPVETAPEEVDAVKPATDSNVNNNDLFEDIGILSAAASLTSETVPIPVPDPDVPNHVPVPEEAEEAVPVQGLVSKNVDLVKNEINKQIEKVQKQNEKNDFEETKSYRFTFGICLLICIFIPEMKEEQLNKKKLFISKKEFEDQQSISILNNHIRLIKFITNIILVYLLFLLFQLRFIDAINSILFTLKIIFPLFFAWYIGLTIWFRRFNINIIFRSSLLTMAIIGFLYFVAYVMFKIFNSLQTTIKFNVSTNSFKNLKLNADINVNT